MQEKLLAVFRPIWTNHRAAVLSAAVALAVGLAVGYKTSSAVCTLSAAVESIFSGGDDCSESSGNPWR